jgi:hypothetical protein
MLNITQLLQIFVGSGANNALVKARAISREWKNCIDATIPNLYWFSQVYRCCYAVLWFDQTIYDQYHYKRLVIRQKNYLMDVKQPRISRYLLDLDDLVLDQFVVEPADLPIEYQVFLHVWKQYTSTTIYPVPDFAAQVIVQNQFKWAESIVLRMRSEDEIRNLVTYCPLLFTVEQDVMKVLCYVNIVNPELDCDFPRVERFCVIDIPITTSRIVAINREYNSDKKTKIKQKAAFMPAVAGKSDAYINVAKLQEQHDEFIAGDCIEVTDSLYNDGFYEVLTYSSSDGILTIRSIGLHDVTEHTTANQLALEEVSDDRPVTITGDTVRSGFRKLYNEISRLSEAILDGTETKYLPKNVASGLSSFAILFRKFR